MNRRSLAADHEFFALLDAFCNGGLSEESAERFDAILRENADARALYLEFMAVEAEMHACHAHGAGYRVDRAEPPSRFSLASRLTSRFVLAASLIGVAALSSLGTLGLSKALRSDDGHALATAGSPDATAQQDSERPSVAVASISATRNCRWRQPLGEVGFGADLFAGQRLDLEAGFAEIEFKSGVKVILEGPASLDLNDGRDARLLSGRLAATVPSEANWFTVSTGRIGVGDRESQGPRAAAEFGLLSDGLGGGEVHVFDGSVNAHLLNTAGAEVRTVMLRSSEAASVLPASTTVARFQADGDRFVRSLFSGGGPHNGLYAYEGFDYPGGPLSWQNGGFGWAGPWADLESAAAGEASNVVEEESLEFGRMPSVGNRAIQAGQNNRIRRVLSTSIGGVFDTAGLVENRDGHRLIGREGKRIYVSFLQRVDKLDDVFYGFELNRGDGNGNRVLCVGNGADGAGYGATSNYNAYGKQNYPRLGDESTDVNLLIARIEFGVDDRDEVTVYRNPESLLDESQCRVDGVMRGNFAFDRISLGNFEGSKRHEIDEVRIGTNFRAVTGRRDPRGEGLERQVAGLRTAPLPFATARLTPVSEESRLDAGRRPASY